MKYLLTFNESIRDKMTPKSEDVLKKSASKLKPYEKMEMGCVDGVLWLVKQAVEEDGIDVNDENFEYVRAALEYGNPDVAVYLLNKGAYLEVNIGDLENSVNEGEIEEQLKGEGIFRGDARFEHELANDYDYALKRFLIGHITYNKETKEVPDNYLDLVDTLEYEEIYNDYDYLKRYKIKIGEPIWL